MRRREEEERRSMEEGKRAKGGRRAQQGNGHACALLCSSVSVHGAVVLFLFLFLLVSLQLSLSARLFVSRSTPHAHSLHKNLEPSPCVFLLHVLLLTLPWRVEQGRLRHIPWFTIAQDEQAKFALLLLQLFEDRVKAHD